jgi:hypothetical protein
VRRPRVVYGLSGKRTAKTGWWVLLLDILSSPSEDKVQQKLGSNVRARLASSMMWRIIYVLKLTVAKRKRRRRANLPSRDRMACRMYSRYPMEPIRGDELGLATGVECWKRQRK